MEECEEQDLLPLIRNGRETWSRNIQSSENNIWQRWIMVIHIFIIYGIVIRCFSMLSFGGIFSLNFFLFLNFATLTLTVRSEWTLDCNIAISIFFFIYCVLVLV
jgi:hypothetical protein